MRIKTVLLIAAVIACLAGGFLLGQRWDRMQSEKRHAAEYEVQQRHEATMRADAAVWAEDLARTEGESLLQAFVAGIAPAVAAQRNETVELAAVAMLRITGIAGIHVLNTDGSVLYSSDAKLSTTGDTQYRGSWALQATELVSRPSGRPSIIDYAMPVASGGNRVAVAWLEYDLARVLEASRPASLGGESQETVPTDEAAMPSSEVENP